MKRAASLLVLLFLFSAATAFAETGADLNALLETYAHPKLGDSVKVENLVVPLSDRMTIRLGSGSLAPVSASGKQIGFFFTGTGKFEYLSTRKDEAVNLKFEAKKTTDLTVADTDKGVLVTNPFDEVYVRVGGVALPAFPSAAGAPLADAFAKHLESMSKRRNISETHLLVKQRIDSPKAPVAVAEFFAEGKPLMFALDKVNGWTEGLYAFYKNRTIGVRELANNWWGITISEQPAGRSYKDVVVPPYILSDLDYSLVADDEDAKLSITETIMPLNAPQSVYQFSLHNSIFDSRGGARQFKLKSVTDAAGKPLQFEHANEDLVIALPSPAGVEQKFVVKYEIEGRFLIHPEGDSYWELGTSAWFPQPDLNGQYYTIHSLIKIKKPWVAFAPGQTVRRGEEGDFNVVENRIDKPVQFAVALGGKYSYDEEKFGDLTVRVASYAGSNPRAQKQLAKLANSFIKFYEPWLGPFPFKEFNIIEIHSLGFGQAPPATMFITKEAFNPLASEENKFFSQGINHRYAHEIAHQYWGHVVKMPSSEEQWITESFAEYSSALLMKEMKGKSTYDSMFAQWTARANDAKEYSSIALANRISIPNDPRQGFMARTALIYDKGAVVLAAVHKKIGDAKFLKFMRALQGVHQWRYLSTNDVAQMLKKVEPGTDWDAFFETYYWGTEMPKS